MGEGYGPRSRTRGHEFEVRSMLILWKWSVAMHVDLWQTYCWAMVDLEMGKACVHARAAAREIVIEDFMFAVWC